MSDPGGREESSPPFGLRLAARTERLAETLRRYLRRGWRLSRGQPIEVLLRLEWRLGDEVMALPAFEVLRRGQPGMRLSARLHHPELLVGNPWVHAINPLRPRPDLELDLSGEVPGEARRRTIARRIGASLEGVVPRVYLSAQERLEPLLPELGALPRPIVAIHSGASQACKSWRAENWLLLARRLRAEGISLVEVGRGREALGVGLDLVGRTGVRELARVLGWADLTLGEDSGPLHLALAVGRPAMGLFGATDPALLYPPGDGLSPILTRASCRFCWPEHRLAWPQGVCPLEQHPCMNAIGPDEVLRAVLSRLGAPGTVPA